MGDALCGSGVVRESLCVGVALCGGCGRGRRGVRVFWYVGVLGCGNSSVWEFRGMESQCVGVVGCGGLQCGEVAVCKVVVWVGCGVDRLQKGRIFGRGSCG